MPAPAALGRLHVLTDTRGGRDPLPVIAAALDAGAPTVQVRAKELTDRDLHDLAARVAERCRAYGAQCIVDDRVDIALAVGADGVHVGADDLPVAPSRRLVGDGALVGATARDAAAARAHERDGASYVGAGPCYATTTKAGLPDPLGPGGLATIAAAVRIPVIAIAGVTAARVPELVAAGAYGVAVVGAVSEADDPGVAVKELLAALDAAPER